MPGTLRRPHPRAKCPTSPATRRSTRDKLRIVTRRLVLLAATTLVVASSILTSMGSSASPRTERDLRQAASHTLGQKSFVVLETVPAGEEFAAFVQRLIYQASDRTHMEPLLPCHPNPSEDYLTPTIAIGHTIYLADTCSVTARWSHGPLTTELDRLVGPLGATAQLRYLLVATSVRATPEGYRFRTSLTSKVVYGFGSGKVVLSGIASVRGGLVRSISLDYPLARLASSSTHHSTGHPKSCRPPIPSR